MVNLYLLYNTHVLYNGKGNIIMKVRSSITTTRKSNNVNYDYEFYKSYNYEKSKYFKINYYPSEHKPAYFRWEYKDTEFLSPASYSFNSRYEKISTLSEFGKSYHVTNRLRGVDYSDEDYYYEVTNETENRLDKISQIHYNTPNYWWAIAHANNIFDAFNIPRGIKLRIPTINNIEKLYFN